MKAARGIPPKVQLFVCDFVIKVLVQSQEGGSYLIACHVHSCVIDKGSQLFHVQFSVLIEIMCVPCCFQLRFVLNGEFDEAQISCGRNSHTTRGDPHKNHKATDCPVENIPVGHLQSSAEEVQQSTSPSVFQEFAVVSNARSQKARTRTWCFEGSDHDSKKDSIHGNDETTVVEGEESIQNSNSIGKHHGQSTQETQHTKGQWSVSASLFDLVGRLIDKVGSSNRSSSRHLVVDQFRSFRFFHGDDEVD